MQFKEKLQPFLSGVLIGIVVAGAFFILKLDHYFKELDFYKRKPQQVNIETTDTIQNTKTRVAKTTSPKNPITYTQKQAAIIKPVTDSAKTVADSIATDDENIVVRKDNLIERKSMDILFLNQMANINQNEDSLLQVISGVKQEVNKKTIDIELWQSPLNYKGYKLSKSKLMVYGIAPEEQLQLYKLDEIIYLKANNTVYKLEFANDFKSFEKVYNEALTAKLK